MFELTAANAPAYLTARGLPAPHAVTELGGGVSNTVLLVEGDGARYVVKQSLGKLRVEQDWFSDRGRIFRESAALRVLAACLPAGGVPEVLWEDRANCLFAMTAAPADAPTWKAQLMAGTIETGTAARIGEMLAALVRHTRDDADAERAFGDQTVFDQLRLDPYYRATAARHPELAPHIDRLLRATAARRYALVHGDWSPKNFLVHAEGVMAIDCEVIHYGDPAFDAAFLLNHLALKSIKLPQHSRALAAAAAAFWGKLDADAAFEAATIEHLGALMLARVDGKSPAEYLDTEELKARTRSIARGLLLRPPCSVGEAFAGLQE